MKKTILTLALMGSMLCTQAQKVTRYTTTEGEAWQRQQHIRLVFHRLTQYC